MGNVKSELIRIFQEFYYHKAMLKLILSKTKGGYVSNARDELMRFSPKPVGYYADPENKPIDPKIDLSIIVPIYNVENYIQECLESVIHQETVYTYEVICIDDGSPDCSIDILNRYANQHQNIRVIRQENRGLSGARNRGIDEAIGKYVMFLDSDDRINRELVQTLMDEIVSNQLDIVCSGFCMFNGKNERKDYVDSSEIDACKMDKHPCYFWGKIYKRSFFDNLRLAEGYLFEDMQVLHVFPRLCDGYKYVSKPLYEYRQNMRGISSTASAKPKSVDQYWMVEFIEDEYERLGLEETDEVKIRLLKELGPYLYNRTNRLPEDVRKMVFSTACDKVNSWSLKADQMSRANKRLLNAFRRMDFYQWEIASSCWHN